LVCADTDHFSRPDRSHYVVDPLLDVVELRDTGDPEVDGFYRTVIIWVDPKHRDAWKDKALLDFVSLQESKGMGSMLRFGNTEAYLLVKKKGVYTLKRSELTPRSVTFDPLG
jgi:hypothetical protein